MLNTGTWPRTLSPADYVTVAASSNAAPLELDTGAVGNLLVRLIIVPATTAAGTITLIDGTGGSAVSIPIFVTGTLSDLSPIPIELGITSVVGAWHLTTGANVSVIAVGIFT